MKHFTFVPDDRDSRLADYLRLTDVELRKSLEAEQGLFMAEGEKVIRRAAAAGYAVRSLLATERKAAALADLADLAAACGAPAYVVPEPVAERLTGYHVHRGALAAMCRRPLPAVAEVLGRAGTPVLADMAGLANVGVAVQRTRPASRILVLEDIIDHGNVGGIFSCAAALGVDAVILSPRCADPLYRRAIKVSMGAVFAIPYARMTDWYGGLAELRAAEFRLLALLPINRPPGSTKSRSGSESVSCWAPRAMGFIRWLPRLTRLCPFSSAPARWPPRWFRSTWWPAAATCLSLPDALNGRRMP